jgi:NAD(P)-dependent dehydrogenase (short-subunit alcohol dehydrogenase family)
MPVIVWQVASRRGLLPRLSASASGVDNIARGRTTMPTLQDKVVLVTGASRGIGARDAARTEALAARIEAAGGRAAAALCDVSDHAAVAGLVSATLARFGRLDALINNAGVIEPIASLATADPAAWAHNIAINLVGAFHCIRACLDPMRAAGGGTIVNISSGAAHRPLEGWSAYCSAKAGLAMLTRAVALEHAADGIRVFGFAPGTIDTDMQVTIRASGVNQISKIPRADLAPVAHPAKAIVYLCSAEADDLAGQELSLRDADLRRRIGLPAI